MFLESRLNPLFDEMDHHWPWASSSKSSTATRNHEERLDAFTINGRK
jgi:hypothetical protein